MATDNGPDLDTINQLQGRITAALDRIAGAAAANAVAAQSPEPDPRVVELEAKVQELTAAVTAAETVAAEAETARADAAVELENLKQAQEEASARVASDQNTEMEALRGKADRLRDERNAIRDERDTLAEELDGYRNGTASGAEESGPAGLLQAIRDLRQANSDLRAESEGLRQSAVAGEGAPAPDTLNAAMAAELLSLRAERAADAAEMQLILDELAQMTEGAADA